MISVFVRIKDHIRFNPKYHGWLTTFLLERKAGYVTMTNIEKNFYYHDNYRLCNVTWLL